MEFIYSSTKSKKTYIPDFLEFQFPVNQATKNIFT